VSNTEGAHLKIRYLLALKSQTTLLLNSRAFPMTRGRTYLTGGRAGEAGIKADKTNREQHKAAKKQPRTGQREIVKGSVRLDCTFEEG
jgi:hypothetical protein